MSKKKITYRSPVVWNVILFIIFSLIFLFLQNAYRDSIPLINHQSFISYVKSQGILVGLFGATIICVYRMNKLVSIFYWLTASLTASITIFGLWEDFSKSIIVLLFVYMLMAYYLFQFLKEDIRESYYNPQFEDKFLFEPMCFKIPVTIIAEGNESWSGHLTNWSEGGFFVYLPEASDLNGTYSVTIDYEGHSFETDARIVTKIASQNGFGFKVVADKEGLNWKKFLDIIYEMGFQPELLV